MAVFPGAAILHERKSGFEILDLAAVGDVFELTARLADVSKIKAQRQDTRLPQACGRGKSASRYSYSTPCRGTG